MERSSETSQYREVKNLIARLLNSRNKCLQKILDLSRGFAKSCEGDGELNGLAAFEKDRDLLFRALALHENKITMAVSALEPAARTPALIARVRTATQVHASLVAEITSEDNQIMARIEREKQAVLEARTISRKQKVLNDKFKSTWVPESGEELDRKL
jgi:hypothetical protein